MLETADKTKAPAKTPSDAKGARTIPYAILIIACFLTEAAYMCFELVAQRVMSPWFGNSSIVWTAIIGVILASGAVGSWLGGKVADSKYRNGGFVLVCAASSLLCMAIPYLKDAVLPVLSSVPLDSRLTASAATLALFFAPSCAMGFLVPMLISSTVSDMDDVGRSTGKMYAISTIGGIAGTFAGGFLIIPSFASMQVVFGIAGIFAICAVMFSPFTGNHKANAASAILGIICLVLSIMGAVSASSSTTFGSFGVKSFEKDTEYSKVIIYDDVHHDNGRTVRSFYVGGGYESLSYTDPDLLWEPVNPYIATYDWAYKIKPDAKKTMMIGGAGYTYPKHLISTYPALSIDVVEIDPGVTEIARKHFFLDELIEEYDTDESGRLGLIAADGRIYLNTTEEIYDVIFNDAFTGSTPPPSLCTVEAVQAIHDHLVAGGVYATNIICPDLENERDRAFLESEMATISQVFENVVAVHGAPEGSFYSAGNVIVFASDAEIPEMDRKIDVDWSGTVVLTDDYCPVEKMTYRG